MDRVNCKVTLLLLSFDCREEFQTLTSTISSLVRWQEFLVRLAGLTVDGSLLDMPLEP